MSEINIPERHDYKAITPFRLFVKSNFPFIESTYEALDNYGLYCKVVEYLNNVIENENHRLSFFINHSGSSIWAHVEIETEQYQRKTD